MVVVGECAAELALVLFVVVVAVVLVPFADLILLFLGLLAAFLVHSLVELLSPLRLGSKNTRVTSLRRKFLLFLSFHRQV